MAKSCGRVTARSTAPSWSETSTRVPVVRPRIGSPTSMAPSSSPQATRREGFNFGGATARERDLHGAGHQSGCGRRLTRVAHQRRRHPPLAGNGGVADWELWRSDGTAEGTSLVMDIAPGSEGSFPSSLVALEGELYFTANNGTHGVELWKSDGTPQGTVVIADIAPRGFTVVGDKLFFPAKGARNGQELWESDGTASAPIGPDIRPGSAGSSPESLKTSTERCSSRRTGVRPVSSFGRATGPRAARNSSGRFSTGRAVRIPAPSRQWVGRCSSLPRTGQKVRSYGEVTEPEAARCWSRTSILVRKAPTHSRSQSSKARCCLRLTTGRAAPNPGRATGP